MKVSLHKPGKAQAAEMQYSHAVLKMWLTKKSTFKNEKEIQASVISSVSAPLRVQLKMA